MGTLYLVATPIGNIADITLRAIKTLKEVDFIACEDTRKTGLLLKRLKIIKKSPLISFYEENEQVRIPQLIKYLKEGKNLALVSNAGTPSISDPGFKLVREAINQGVRIDSLPGACSIITALTVSGLPTDKFLFLGYLPKKQGKQKEMFKKIKNLPIPATVIFFESPHRLSKTLKNLKEILGNKQIVVCQELTKLFQNIKRGKTSQLAAFFIKKKPRGEFTILF